MASSLSCTLVRDVLTRMTYRRISRRWYLLAWTLSSGVYDAVAHDHSEPVIRPCFRESHGLSVSDASSPYNGIVNTRRAVVLQVVGVGSGTIPVASRTDTRASFARSGGPHPPLWRPRGARGAKRSTLKAGTRKQRSDPEEEETLKK